MKNKVKDKIIYYDSDDYHINNFKQMKLTKWVYLPVFGTVLFWFIYKLFCDVNLIDRLRAYKTRTKFAIFYLIILAIFLIFIAMLLISFTTKVFDHFNKLKYVIVCIPLYIAIFAFSILPLIFKWQINWLIISNKNLVVNKDKIYYRVWIENDLTYFENLAKNINAKLTKTFLSDNFEKNEKGMIINKTGKSRIEILEESAQNILDSPTMNFATGGLFGLLILRFIRFFDYYFSSIIILQKIKNDHKKSLSRKINLILAFSKFLTWIIWIFFITSLILYHQNEGWITNFDNLQFSLFLIIYLTTFVFISILRAQLIKKMIVQMCIHTYKMS
ncbi:hypothetical protein [Mesomycoplasma lagogenitalium]|uniref:RDD domain-containing protein n=1 Tax=Mesomycoplasma lagogenitalium TaxID=171286 RepID=A0ABY8LSY9_9BACT|nr:hypothetical protein [Mesomycoplasma lagogenitalium]WGI36362.1 hypothetical protein QEG99_02685 [Mesomycoplasma lagogenitalium]